MKDAVKALVKNEQGEILVLFRSETYPSLAHDIVERTDFDSYKQVVAALGLRK